MAEPFPPTSEYKPAPLASLPPQLDPGSYTASPEKRRADGERLAIRARLKRQYLLQLNDPRRTDPVTDPSVTRWTYARMRNIYPNFRATPKTSLLGTVFGIGPVFVLWYILKKDRERKTKLREEGKYKQPFNLIA